MTVAAVFFALGGFFIMASWLWHLVLIAVPVGAFFYFRFEARASNQELSNVRREVLKKYRNSDENTD
jgi:hypothetical protein